MGDQPIVMTKVSRSLFLEVDQKYDMYMVARE